MEIYIKLIPICQRKAWFLLFKYYISSYWVEI